MTEKHGGVLGHPKYILVSFITENCQELTLLVAETKIAEFANCVDLDEVAQKEPPHLDLHCFPSSL